MSADKKSAMPKVFDLPLVLAAGITFAFYWFVTQERMHGSFLHRYTTEHMVEYVIVAFFIWGLTDVLFHVISFPPEFLALRQECLPKRTGREPVSHAAALLAYLGKQPATLRNSRLGRRLNHALSHLQEKGSSDGYSDYLKHLSDQDFELTTSNYGLIRFICWVTPMFGFLGTVVHFGTALSGQSAGEIGDKLPTVVAEMGTAFNTTTVALTAATTMMFSLFLCERTERAIIDQVDERAERELLNRFETVDANTAPFLAIVQATSQASLQAIDTRIERQMEMWSAGLQLLSQQTEKHQQWQTQVWSEALEKLEQRFESNDEEREKRLNRLLEAIDTQRKEQRTQMASTLENVTSVKADIAQLVDQLARVLHEKHELVSSQSILADNLRVLRETQQLDQAMQSLTAAIHLLTARAPTLKERHAA